MLVNAGGPFPSFEPRVQDPKGFRAFYYTLMHKAEQADAHVLHLSKRRKFTSCSLTTLEYMYFMLGVRA